MASTWLWWIVAAVLVFWAVGAYNRLVRLRAEANSAFHALAAQMAQQVTLVESCLPPEEAGSVQSVFEGGSAFWGGLQGAAAQFAASLAYARARPLEPDRIAALGAAQEIFDMAWDRAERDDAHDLAGPRLPEHITGERAQLARQTQVAIRHFNEAVLHYNEAIAQFPALLLAWLFGFHAGRGLRAR
ncbi:MAG: LemA family protein [Rhodocyclales bacterium]|nr:LemA family protein [Rhodocyclales bacterium]